MASVASAAIGIWVGVGSRDEPEALAGASHFLEHLLFKGTVSRSAASIAESLDEVGGDCNAFTTKEYTAFYVRLLAEDAALGLDILCDIITEPALAPADVDAERQVIAEEIAMHGDEPSDLAAELASQLLYPSSPLGRDTLGTRATVAKLAAHDIRHFFEERYRTDAMVVSLAGRIDDRLLERLEQLPSSTTTVASVREVPALPTTQVLVETDDAEQVNLSLAWRSLDRRHPLRHAAAVYNQLLGGGLSSRLFQEVRERRGLTYSIWSEREAYSDAGAISIIAGTAAEHTAEVVEICLSQVAELAMSGPSVREVEVAKSNLRAELLLSHEDSGARMSRMAAQALLHGSVTSIEGAVEALSAVDIDQVAEVARLVAEATPVLAAVGPISAAELDGILAR